MKKIKLFAVLCCAVVCAFTLSSCEKQKTVKYDVAILSESIVGYSSIAPDHNALEEYLKSKDCPVAETWSISDASVEKCDAQAKAKFEALVSKLSREEIAEKVSDGYHFTYGCMRESEIIATWEYPAK